MNMRFNSGSTIQGDHILAFSQTQENGFIPNEITWNTQHSGFSDFFLVCEKWSPCLMEPLLKCRKTSCTSSLRQEFILVESN